MKPADNQAFEKASPAASLIPEASCFAGDDESWQQALNGASSAILDFDETLLTANSTHLYLASAFPALPAYLIVRAIDAICARIYRADARGMFVHRDWLRVLAVSLVLPWSLPLWTLIHAPRAARKLANDDLLKKLKEKQIDVDLVMSFGFSIIIRPILRSMNLRTELIANPILRPPSLRKTGKLPVLEAMRDERQLARSVYITDSADDADVLSHMSRKALIKWGGAHPQPFADVYVPFLYTERVKRDPGYMRRGVIFQDCAAITLSLDGLWSAPPILLAAVVFLQLSFWALYEFGYFDNDKRAAHEENGRVPSAFAAHAARMRFFPALGFSALFAAVGSHFVVLAGADGIIAKIGLESIGWAAIQLTWGAFCLCSLGFFMIYNRTAPASRIFLYPVLQMLRLCGIALVFGYGPMAVALIGAFVVGRTIPYIVYRAAGVRWGSCNRILVALLFSILLLLNVISGTLPLTPENGMLSLGVAAWLFIRSHRDIRSLGRGIAQAS